MMIVLSDGETVDSVTINGHTWAICPYDIIETSDERRVVTLFGNRPATKKSPDLNGLKIASTCDGTERGAV